MPEPTDRDVIAKARKLRALRDPADVREHTGDSDPLGSYVAAFGEAQELLEDLAIRLERHGGS